MNREYMRALHVLEMLRQIPKPITINELILAMWERPGVHSHHYVNDAIRDLERDRMVLPAIRNDKGHKRTVWYAVPCR